MTNRFPEFLPDGKHFIYSSGKGTDYSIRVGTIDGTSDQELMKTDSVSGAVYHPAGYLLFRRGNSLTAVRFDPDSLRVSGDPFLAFDADTDSSIEMKASVALDGTIVHRPLSGIGGGKLAWRDRSGGLLLPAFDFPGAEPDISVDGHRAAVIRNVSNGNSDIWIIDLARNVPSRFTSDLVTELWPTWLPSGDRLMFGMDPRTTLWVQSLTGERHEFRIKARRGTGAIYPCDWSRDGKYLLYRETVAQGDLWAADASGEGTPIAVAVSAFDESRGQFSPDGKWVSYESNESGQSEVYVRPFNRSAPAQRVSVNGGYEARWNPDGHEIFFISNSGMQLMSVAVKPETTGGTLALDPPRALFPLTITSGRRATSYKFQYAVAPDGKRFLVNEDGNLRTEPLVVTMNWRPPQ